MLPSETNVPGNDITEEDMAGPLSCPVCQRATTSLKRLEFPRVVFLPFLPIFCHCSYRIDILTACPRCLRRYLAYWGIVSLIPANLLWPLVVFPLLLCRLLASFLPGHRLKKKSLPKKIVGGVAVIGIVPASLLAGIWTVVLFTGSPETSQALLALLGYSVITLAVFAVLGALADV